MVTCPQCGSEQPDGTAFCDNCGYALGKGGAQPRLGDQNASQDGAPTVVASNNCPSCGASVPPGEDFCPNCGGQLVGNTGQSAGSMPEPRIPQQQPEPRPSGSQAGHMLTCPSCGAQLAPLQLAVAYISNRGFVSPVNPLTSLIRTLDDSYVIVPSS